MLKGLGLAALEVNKAGIVTLAVRDSIDGSQSGRHVLDEQRSYLVYMPHCPKELYEEFLAANFTPRLGQKPRCLLLGNDLAEYDPSLTRREEAAAPARLDEPFEKPKRKRKGKTSGPREPKDGTLYRIGGWQSSRGISSVLTPPVPHTRWLPLAELPETNLPGFARALLSLGVQWLPSDNVDDIDWDTPLPPIERGETSEMRDTSQPTKA